MQLSKMIPEVDTHTHTILSGHAWSPRRAGKGDERPVPD